MQCNIITVKQKLFDIYKVKWKSEKYKKPKLCNYIQIKDDFQTEISFNIKLKKAATAPLRSAKNWDITSRLSKILFFQLHLGL